MPGILKGNNLGNTHFLTELNVAAEGFCLLYVILEEFCLLTRFGGKVQFPVAHTISPACLPLRSPLTWLWTVFSWLLKVMVRLVDVLGATCVMKGVLLWFTVSYMFTRRLQISMFWKHDLTLFTQKAETEALGKDKKVRWNPGEKTEREQLI